jgi:uncharacterized protein
VAIIGMIQVHIVEWLSGYYDYDTTLYQLSELIGSFPAALFTFLVGMSFFISINRQEKNGIDPGLIADRNLRRGMAIFFLGLLFAIFVWMPDEVFSWDILTFIGASLLILYPLRKLSPATIITKILIIIAISPVVRIFTDYHSHWNEWGEYVPSFEMPGMLMGFFANGYFPLLPWLVFPLSGYLVGRACFGDDRLRLPKALLPLGIGLLIASLVMIALSSALDLSGMIAEYISPFTFYPASTSFILLAVGVNVVLFVIFFYFFDLKERKKEDNLFLIFCNRYSRYALTAYVVHHVLFLWGLIAYAAYTRELFRWQHYGYIMPTHYSLLVVLLFVILFYIIIVAWDKREGRYSFEWLLRRLTG